MRQKKDIVIVPRVVCDEKIKKSQHYPLILEVEQVIYNRFPFGSINRVDVVEDQKIPEEELKNQMRIMVSSSHESDKLVQDISPLKLVYIMQTMLFGECGSLVNYAIGFCKKKYPKKNVECIYLDNHAQLLIGRQPNTNPEDIKTWNESAVIYDIWADKSYFASEFTTMQEQSDDIPFYSPVVDNESNEVTGFITNKTHYLSGQPVVYTGFASKQYDQKLVVYVQEDQKIWNQSDCKVPQISSSSLALDAEKIKSSLKFLSKCSGWKLSSKNIAWIECKDQNQAERISRALKASKAMVVTLTKRIDNHIPVVKCEHFNLNKIDLLVNSLYLAPVNEVSVYGINK